MTKRPPFIVLQVDDLVDQNGVLQGQMGYSNPLVMPNDTLIRVDGMSVESTTVQNLHHLLGGRTDSLVQLCFSRSTGEEYTVKAKRHTAHCVSHTSLERSVAPAGENPPVVPRIAKNEAVEQTHENGMLDEIVSLRSRVQVLEKEKADLNINLSQLVMEMRSTKQESKEQIRLMEKLDGSEQRRASEAEMLAKDKNDLEITVDKLTLDLNIVEQERNGLQRAIVELKESDRIRASVMDGKETKFENERAQLRSQLDQRETELDNSFRECRALRTSLDQLAHELKVANVQI